VVLEFLIPVGGKDFVSTFGESKAAELLGLTLGFIDFPVALGVPSAMTDVGFDLRMVSDCNETLLAPFGAPTFLAPIEVTLDGLKRSPAFVGMVGRACPPETVAEVPTCG
jgi:hypothetical protein